MLVRKIVSVLATNYLFKLLNASFNSVLGLTVESYGTGTQVRYVLHSQLCYKRFEDPKSHTIIVCSMTQVTRSLGNGATHFQIWYAL
jgi:hypothetical protein